jgi:mevalonate kinase
MPGRNYSASAPGKVILFGEHAVVYGYPAIAAPVNDLRATAEIEALESGSEGKILIDAPDIQLHTDLASLSLDHPLSLAIRGTLAILKIPTPPAFKIRIHSTIPVASGLGSGAAVSVAVIRAISGFLEKALSDEIVSGLAYEVEKLHHGTPSGIDNTVISYAQPIFFQRGEPFEILPPHRPLTLVIADTGIASPTGAAVAGVRQRHDASPDEYHQIFEEIGQIASAAREALLGSSSENLGELMNANHLLLQHIGVSCPPLDRLVESALQAGSPGAKLSGGGLGGNMIALSSTNGNVEKISSALLKAGAVRCYVTTISASGEVLPDGK